MNYDVRSGEYLFKHATEEIEEIDASHHIPHSHTSYELYYFISGEGEFFVEDKGYRLYPGSVVLIRPGTDHHLVIKDTETYERIVIRFPEDDLADSIREGLKKAENYYFVRNSEVGKEILQLDVHFMNIADSMILSTFKMTLNLILMYIINFQPEKSGTYAENDRITRVVNFIDNNLTEIESLDYICKGLHMSKSALCKLFTSEMGVPIMSYVRYKKCVVANALIESGISPTKAYQEAGFSDYSTFYRIYTRVYRHSPSFSKMS